MAPIQTHFQASSHVFLSWFDIRVCPRQLAGYDYTRFETIKVPLLGLAETVWMCLLWNPPSWRFSGTLLVTLYLLLKGGNSEPDKRQSKVRPSGIHSRGFQKAWVSMLSRRMAPSGHLRTALSLGYVFATLLGVVVNRNLRRAPKSLLLGGFPKFLGHGYLSCKQSARLCRSGDLDQGQRAKRPFFFSWGGGMRPGLHVHGNYSHYANIQRMCGRVANFLYQRRAGPPFCEASSYSPLSPLTGVSKHGIQYIG